MHSLQPPVVREAGEAGRDFDCLVYCLFFFFFPPSYFPFWSRLVFRGALLGERIMMSVSTPSSPTWDTALSLSPMSAYRGTDKEPENQGPCVLVRACTRVCACQEVANVRVCV